VSVILSRDGTFLSTRKWSEIRASGTAVVYFIRKDSRILCRKADMSATHNNIPARYDPNFKIKPCDPARVPHLPVQILYLIARALPDPKSVFKFAGSSEETWDCWQPAFFECEVTLKSRLLERYGGNYPTNLYNNSDDGREESEEASTTSFEEPDQTFQAQASDEGRPHTRARAPEQFREWGGRIQLEDRTFQSPMPDNFAD
jgi:hypothetical protein